MKNLILLLLLLVSCQEKEPTIQGTPKIPFGFIKISESWGNTDLRYHLLEIRKADWRDQTIYHYEVGVRSYDGDVFLPEARRTVSVKSNGVFEVVEKYTIKRSGDVNPNTGDWVKEIEMIVYVRANYLNSALLEGYIDFPQYERTIDLTQNLIQCADSFGYIYLSVQGVVEIDGKDIKLELLYGQHE